jgi:hypothetical protein
MPGTTSSPVKSDLTLRSEVVVATALAIALTILTYRAGRIITFDGYHYVEFAKKFATEWPDRFGNHWPFGWPLAGGLLGRIGRSGYDSLLSLSLLSTIGLLFATARALPADPRRIAVLLGLAATPVIAPQFGGVLTELPFATALMGLGVLLAHWPHRGALWGAAGCAVLALTIRYAGLVALAMIGTHLVFRWQALRASRRLGEALASLAVAGVVSGALLAWNVIQTGHASGAGRGNSPGLGAIFSEFASFGWSAPSAMIAGGLRDRLGPESLIGIGLGAAIFLALAALCTISWLRPRSAYSQPLAIVALGYAVGMAVLHCIGEFDALYNARTFVPALAPVLVLLAERLSERRLLLVTLMVGLSLAGIAAAVRGISREIGGDVAPAAAALRPLLRPGDRIVINDHAMSLGIYLPQPTERIAASGWQESASRTFIVTSGKPQDRHGNGAVVSSDWVALAARLVESARYRYLINTPSLIVLAPLP